MNQHEADDRYDVVVAGARVAGASTAMLLARRGFRVLLIDPVPPERDALSTHALMRAGALQLHRWGVLDAIRGAGTPAVRATVFHYGEDTLPVPIKPSDGLDGLYAPRRFILDRVLVDAAVRAGAHVELGAALLDLSHDRHGRVDGAVVQSAPDAAGRRRPARVVSARWVVGADGLRSRVARLVEAPLEHEGAHATAVLYGYWPSAHPGEYNWYFGDRAYAGAIATNDGESCVFVGMPPDEFQSHRSGGLPALLRRVLLRIPAADGETASPGGCVPRLRGFGGVRGFLRRSAGPGWALVGDAGCFKDPATAHGITDAFRDAELLVGAVEQGTDEALRDYQRERDMCVRGLLETSDQIASFKWDMDGIRELHLQLNADMKIGMERVRALGPAPAAGPVPVGGEAPAAATAGKDPAPIG